MSLPPGDRLSDSLDERTVAIVLEPIAAGSELSRPGGGVSGKGILAPPIRGSSRIAGTSANLIGRETASQQSWPMILGIGS